MKKILYSQISIREQFKWIFFLPVLKQVTDKHYIG